MLSHKLLIGLSTAMLSSISVASELPLKFSASVIVENNLPYAVDISIPSGESASIKLKNGLRLEVNNLNVVGQSSPSVKLYDDNSATPRLIHSAKSESLKSPNNWSVSYTVCSGHAQFSSPAPAVPLSCPM
ncbi:hypothetical protein [Aquirhabdus parva]|uniref:Uncharacterized protein n=1 Tax=Aquirhabdus parva TaxID=2283318 RepID=A0A345P9D9_9GAMM|nr:hypothetical protein [Aquirhabdus parva]AXI03898.1 hypothetical protein HYN46_14250 [Aquirhabdus parva]